MKTKEIIIVPHGGVKKLAKVFGCDSGLVSKALRGKITGGLAPKIRHTAMKEFKGKKFITEE